MDRSKSLAVSLIVLFFLSTLAIVLHHHENTADDHDCPICIASNHQAATNASAVVFDGTPYVTETTSVVPAAVLADAFFSFSRSTRGPPDFSFHQIPE